MLRLVVSRSFDSDAPLCEGICGCLGSSDFVHKGPPRCEDDVMFVVRGRRIWIWIARNGDGFSILMSPIEIKKARQCGGTAESEARTEQAREYVGRSEGFACTFARRAAILGWVGRVGRSGTGLLVTRSATLQDLVCGQVREHTP